MSTMAATEVRTGGMTKDERFSSRLIARYRFEWYDFYLYGSLASIIGAQFSRPIRQRPAIFSRCWLSPPAPGAPFGAIVSGRIGDIVGRKYTFLVTILIMGLSTFIVGLLPNAATIALPHR